MDKDKRVVVRRTPAEWQAIMSRFERSGRLPGILYGRGSGAEYVLVVAAQAGPDRFHRRDGRFGVADNRKFQIPVNRKLRTSDWRHVVPDARCWLGQQGRGSAGCTDGRQECG